MTSENFRTIKDYILVNPDELYTGESTTSTGLVMELESNNSIIDRPTEGVVIRCGVDTQEIRKEMRVKWVETDGQDVELDDGNFIILKETSILGYEHA